MSESAQSKWGKPSRERTVADWADEHGLYQWMLPLRTRKVNPLELIETISNCIDGLPKTQSTITQNDIGAVHLYSGYHKGIIQLFRLRRHENCSCKARYHNPQYMHYGHGIPAITDTEERMAFWEQYKRSPTLTSEWMAEQWGMQPDSVTTWLYRRGIRFSDVLLQNKHRMGRTLYTISEWGHDLHNLCRNLPSNTPWRTYKDWAYEYGKRADGWEPPSRPTDEPWYRTQVANAELY